MGRGLQRKKRPNTRAGGGGGEGGFEKPKARGSTAGYAAGAVGVGLKLKKSDVRFGNKEGGGTHFGSEERFAWQKSKYASDAMYTIPDVKAPPFSFGTSTRADWKKIMENTRDLYNPNCEADSIDHHVTHPHPHLNPCTDTHRYRHMTRERGGGGEIRVRSLSYTRYTLFVERPNVRHTFLCTLPFGVLRELLYVPRYCCTHAVFPLLPAELQYLGRAAEPQSVSFMGVTYYNDCGLTGFSHERSPSTNHHTERLRG